MWDLLVHMVDQPDDHTAMKQLDDVRANYNEMYESAVATVYDHTHGTIVLAERESRAEIVRLRQALHRQRRLVEELQAGDSRTGSLTKHLIHRLRSH